MAKGKYANKSSGKGGLIALLLITVLVVAGCVVGIFLVLNDKKPQPAGGQSLQTVEQSQPTPGETKPSSTPSPSTQPTPQETTEETTAPTEETTAPTEETTVPTEETTIPVIGEDTTVGQQIAQVALAQLGKPYALGGSGPDSFDTTGFICYCLKESGVSAPRRMSQLAQKGNPVEREQLQPGDVVFFWLSNEGAPEYAGIYVGGGKFVAARNEEKPVSELSLNSNYFSQRYVCARRMEE